MPAADTVLLFGPYRLVPAERALYQGARPVRLSGRAFDLLLALIERPGEVVGKDELIARVWPQSFVEEGNLRVHIGTLRKALGGDDGPYVENVVGRGYSFVAPVRRATQAAPDPPAPWQPAARPSPRPQPTAATLASRGRVIGREDAIRQLAAQVIERRLLTVVGPGGMGKTTLALAVAADVAPHFGQRVHFVDLAPLTESSQVGVALAMALGLPALSSDPLPGLLVHLRDTDALLVLDNCEHVIDGAAALAERLLCATARVHILATSREPLRAESECVHRLAPLALPAAVPAGAAPDMALLAASPAVQLFVERATASVDSFRLTEDNAAAVAEICRRLDGIPLAIELAAGRAEFFGVHALAARLEDCFAVLTRGRRTALPRHQTLRATLDWSYHMLPPAEQAILRRFGVFRAPFMLECAVAVAADEAEGKQEGDAADAVLDGIANLVAKSLLIADTGGDTMLYRLLATTRAYALEKLRASGDQDRVARRYAQRCCDIMARAQEEVERQPMAQWLAVYGRTIDHVRAALDWAFGDGGGVAAGDIALGQRLCAVSAPLWYQLSLMGEYRGRLERALRAGGDTLAPATEMPLRLAMGHALLHAGEHSDSRVRSEAFARALDLAQRLDDVSCRMAALWGCYTDAIFNGDYEIALGYAERYGIDVDRHGGELARVGHARMLARVMYYLGRQRSARAHIDFAVHHPLRREGQSRNRGFQFDPHISTLAVQGRILWLQGYPDQAMAVAGQCVEEGLRGAHAISLCFALLLACSVATWSGDEAAGRRYTGMMLEHSQRSALPHWHFWGEGFAAAQRLLHGTGAPDDAAIAALRQSRFCGDLQVDVMATLHPRLLTPRAVERAESGAAGWCRAEVLRGWGESLAQAGAHAQAERCFRRALDIAGEQGAGAWELRAATSLAALLRARERRLDARAPLLAVYERYSEGWGTRDLLQARALLDELG
ncbi:ATP-binding protein [Pseudoduganella namucuonensis]|uniref:Predicted ATPase n=1 Tax=Pseudoduganella namucuonensis TaxID=1035707 RepID=A0A1I7LFT9_9BURK|nr:winged helix-turn-helix domain-containing protein [Pseudoduganella namucuonensis]SFV08532.1 Predicted ATPase [Pseudoduganella namucuonensis]